MTRAGRDCLSDPSRIVHSPSGIASRVIHASESRPLLPDRTLLRDRSTSRGAQPEAGVGTAASPDSQTRVPGTLGARVTCTSRGSRSRRSGQGRLGCTRMGHSCMLIVRGGRCYCSCGWSAPMLCGAVPARGGCYDISVAGSGVCREARGGACVMYVEEHSVDGGRHRAQHSRAHDSTEGDERMREATCADNTNKCQTCNVQIGDSLYCSQCKTETANIAPVNGICKDVSSDTALCKTNAGGKCTQCDGQSFMYQGGCYQTGDQNPGNTLCTSASAGKCTKAAEGYFVLPGANNANQSVVSYGDAANGVTLRDNKKHVGVASCAKCDAPGSLSNSGTAAATCTECATGFLHTSSGSTSCVETCPKGYFEHTATDTQKKTCQSCSGKNAGLTPAAAGVDGCAACIYTSAKVTCAKCETGKYLKTEGSTTSCVRKEACTGGYFPKDESTGSNKCVACSSASDGGITDCSECSLLPSTSRSSTSLITCTKCSSGNLSPLKNECMTTCPAGTYADSNVCTPATRPAQNALMMQSPPAPPAIRGLYSTTVQRLGRARASRSAQESIWKTAPMDSAQLA